MNDMRYLIVMMMAVCTALLPACNGKSHDHAADDGGYYTCSMHPQVVADAPGLCPICHMDLVRVEKNKNADPDALQLNDEQIKLGNIHTDTIREGLFGDKIVLTGALNFNRDKMQSVSARVMGRIEKLYFRDIGAFVAKGDPLLEIYSEELNNAKQEYLLALENKKNYGDINAIDFGQLIGAAKNKLLLWGMTEGQIQALREAGKASATTTFYSTASGYITELPVLEGGYVDEGSTIVVLADLSTVWAEAQSYSSQMAPTGQATTATVQIPDLNGRTLTGNIVFTDPQLNPGSRINLIRVSIPNPGNDLKPGMPAYVFLEPPPTQGITLPVDAVVRDGKKATVWVRTGEKTFKNRMVQTGTETGDRIEIRSGLKPGDVVVVTGAYLLHSEYIFKNGADPMAGHDMDAM